MLQEKYLDSIQGRIDLFNNAVQTMWNNALDSDVIKGFVEFGTGLVKTVDTLGLIPSILAAILTYKLLVSAVKIFNVKDLITYIGLMWTAKDVTELQGLEVNKLSLKQKLLNSELVKATIARAGLTAEEVSGLTTTQLLTLGLKGLAAGFKNLFIAMGPVGWAILGITAALTVGITIFNIVHKTTEELGEELSDLRSELSETQSEIESLNSELETTRDKIAELEAMPSLSLTDQDELKRLKQQNSELERQLQMQEAIAESTKAQIINTSEDYIGQIWDSNSVDKTYTIDSNGVISEDKWNTTGVDTKDALKDAMTKYSQQQQTVEDYKKLIENWDSDKKVQDNFGKFFMYSELRNIDDAKQGLKDAEEQLQEIGNGINLVFSDENFTNLEYGMSDNINNFLDEFYAQQLKWQQIQGSYVKSDAIASIFDSTSTEEIQNLGKELREIADNDALTDEQKNKQIQDRINGIDKTNEAYGRLKTTMETVGVTAKDIADYFVLETGAFDSNTIEGVLKQYQTGINILNDLKESGVSETEWDDSLFEIDDDGKFEARADKFGEILKGMDENTHEAFMNIAESVKNGEKSWDQAISSMNISGIIASTKILEDQWAEVNKTMFKSIDDGAISGWIDTFSELSAALEDVVSSMDLLHSAQQQMNNSGRISIKTALELIEATDQWDQMLTITEGTIRLNANAEDILVQSKLNVIKAQVDEALGAVELQLAQLGAADSAYTVAIASDVSDEAYEQYTNAMNSYSAAIAAFGAALDAAMSGNWGGVISAFSDTYETAKKIANSSADTNKIDRTDLEQRRRDLQAQKDMLNQVGSVSDFKNYYDYERTPGDKYKDKDGDTALEKLQKKYERKISELDNKKTYIENEIEALEENNEGVSNSYYKKQIELEEQKLDIYAEEKAALTELANITPKGTDEWHEIANALWEVDHAMQQSTIDAIKMRKAMIENYENAFENIGTAFSDKDKLFDDSKEYLQNVLDLLDLQGELAHPDMYKDLIAQEQNDKSNNEAWLAAQTDLYNQMMSEANPYEAGSNDAEKYEEDRNAAAIRMQEDMRATQKAIQENDKALQQFNNDLKDLYITGWEKVKEAFDNRGQFIDNQIGYMESYISRLETLNIDVPDDVYDDMIDTQNKLNENNREQLEQNYRDLERLKNELGEEDEQYQSKLLEVAQLEKETYDGETKVIELQNKKLDNQLDRFNKVIDRINDSIKELQNISNLISGEDVAFEDGSWTKEGLTRAGLAFDEIEKQKWIIKDCNEQLAEQKRLLDAGEISQNEYYEKTKSITDTQWEAVNAYKSAEDAIIDLNEARIDMIEEGINKEIDAYQELIDLKKKELDAERDLYDFRKDIQKQTKDIVSLERRIASMSGSSDAATIAERTKLEQQLREAKDSLNDTYYDRAMTSRSDALDDEMESFEKSKTDYLENLRESIKETDRVIEETYQHVMANADIVLTTLTEYSEKYNFTITPNLIMPWKNAAENATLFKDTAYAGIDYLINEDGVITKFSPYAKEKFEEAFGSGSKAAEDFKNDVEVQIFLIKTALITNNPELKKYIDEPWKNPTKENGSLISFSKKVEEVLKKAVKDAISKDNGLYGNMEGYLKSPWDNAKTVVNQWYDNVVEKLDWATTKAQKAAEEIAKAYDVKTPSYDAGGNGETGDGDVPKYTPDPKETKKWAGSATGYIIVENGKQIVKHAQTERKYSTETEAYDAAKKEVIAALSEPFIQYRMKQGDTRSEASRMINSSVKWNSVSAFYAKGTLGTKTDQWAITDEPQYGDELVLMPTAQGNLSYIRKGTSVVPADLTKNLMEWGKLNPNMMDMSSVNGSVNIITNAINKPEINLSIDKFLSIDKVDEGCLPEVKKFVQQQLDNFTKQLNYSLRKVGAY